MGEHDLRSWVVHVGVERVLDRRFRRVEFDLHFGEGGGFWILPVAQEGAVTNSNHEVPNARVLETSDDLCQVSIVILGISAFS